MLPRIIILSLFTVSSIPIIVFDCKTKTFPRIFVQIGTGTLVIGHIICFLVTQEFSILSLIQYFFSYIEAFVISFLLLWATKKISKNGLGGGDILYGTMCAFAVGFPQIPIGYIFSCLYGFIAFIFKQNAKSKNKNVKLAFTPFMFLGSLTAEICFLQVTS